METLIMDVSQLINVLRRQIKEGDVSDQESEIRADFESRNHFKSVDKKKSTQPKKNDNEQRPDSKMNPKQLKDKQSKNPKYDEEAEFEEDDNPLALFNAQITSNIIPTDDEEEETDDNEDSSSTPAIEKNTNIKEKPFNLENCKNYDKFVKIVNSFRASESIRNDKTVKQYWEKLSLAEKQAVYIFFDNLTRVSDAEKTQNFKMPKTPTQLGVKISPAGQIENKIGQNDSNKTTKIDAKPSIDIKSSTNSQNPITPITVGESHKRYISIDALLKEVK